MLSVRRRIFALSGSSQLVPAMAAARKVRDDQQSCEDYLVLYGLNERKHGLPFAEAISSLARQLGAWQRIVYLSTRELRALSWTRRLKATGMMRAKLGVDDADELYLNCVPHYCGGLLSATYPRATGICYGDGIGVNYSPGYFRVEERHGLGRKWTRLRATFRRLTNESLFCGKQPRIDRYCLLLPNVLDTRAPEFERCNPQTCRALFRDLADSMDLLAGSQTELQAALNRASQVVFCLTCNFSEARRMTLDAECDAYREYLARLVPDPDTLLVIKSHPRDDPKKFERMRAVLGGTWRNIFFLAGAPMCYMPFEALYLRHCAALGTKLRLASFSTACLAIKHLWGAHCDVGFGEELVRRYFHPHWVNSRLIHERHLTEALGQAPVSGESYEHALTGEMR